MSLQVCKDRLDPLPDRGQVRPGVGLASTGRTHDGCPKAVHFGGELATGIGLVADEGQACGSLKAPDHLQRHLAIVAIGRGEPKRTRRAVGREDRVQAESPKEPGMRCAISVSGGLAQGRAFDRLARTCALDRGGVDQQHLVGETGAPTGKHADKPLDRIGLAAPALVVSGLGGQPREQVSESLCGDLQEPALAGYSHDRLGDTQRDDLRIGHRTTRIGGRSWQQIIGRAINGDAEQVEVGVHRGPLVGDAFSTADFGLPARNPYAAGIPVESII